MPLKRRTPIRRRTWLKRGKPPRRRGQSDVAKLRQEADDFWKSIVLSWPYHALGAGAGCQARAYAGCLGLRILQAHHIVRRRHWGPRWDLANGLRVCRNCHYWLHNQCLDEPQWYRDHGIDYDALKLRAETTTRKSIDLKVVILALNARWVR